MARAKKIKPMLAKPGDPLITKDGVALIPHSNPVNDDPKLIKMTPQSFKPTKRRSVRDLPAPVPIMNGIAAVFLYTAFGLTEREICEALKITMSQLMEIKNHAAYSEYFDTVLAEFINANSGLMQARLAAYADGAITSLGTLSKEAKHEGTKLRASESVLDRVGVTSKAQENANRAMGNELRILIVDGKDKGVSLELNGQILEN